MDDMNYSISLAQASKFYEWIRFVDEMNDSKSWAQDTRGDEQFMVVVDMNKNGS